ncbi:MAG TPA: IPT/TIG domain-containing protein [Acidobacteriota bacterium]|nr:IPT/TIG domain-containing protein [Acidobacteriota bacterium]
MEQRYSLLTDQVLRPVLSPLRGLLWLLLLGSIAGTAAQAGTDESADLRIVAERAPAGGLAVVVVELTEPKPITSGELCLRYPLGPVLEELENVALLNSSPVTGSAQADGGEVEVTFDSPDASFGNSPDLPIMVLAIPVSAQASPGQSASIEIDLSRTTLRDPQGHPYTVTVKENDFSVGGVSITSLEPLSGIVAGGSFITVRGVGFQPGVEVDFQEANDDDAVFISSTEVRVPIGSDFNLLPTTRVRVRNQDDSEDLFYPAALLEGVAPPPPPQPALGIGRSLLRVAVGQSAEVEVDVEQASPGQSVVLRAQMGSLLQVTPPQILNASSQRLTFRVLGRQAGQSQLEAELGQLTATIPLQVVDGSSLTIPVIRNNADSRLGVALVNRAAEPSQVMIRAFPSTSGGPPSPPAQPALLFLQSALTLQPGEQRARFIDEIEAGLQDFSGWLEVSSLNPGLHATFLNLPAERITYAGDSGSIPAATTSYVTGSSFSASAPPEFSVTHRGLSPLALEVDWIGPEGDLRGQIQETLAGQETFIASFQQLFPQAQEDGFSGYLRVQADQPVVVYQQSLAPDFVFGQGAARPIADSETASGATALVAPGGGRLCLPHLIEGGGFFTEITLINGSPTAAQGQVTFMADSASDPLAGLSATVEMPGNAQRILRVGELLALDSSQLVSGSLIVELPLGSAASAVLGRLDDPGYRTAVPLLPEAVQEAVFAQVASGEVGSSQLFTGLAVADLRDPGSGPDAELLIEVFTESGELAGQASRPLAAGERRALLLTEWIEGLPDQQGGHIRVSSDAPIAIIELFGDFGQTFLSTVSASPASSVSKPR